MTHYPAEPLRLDETDVPCAQDPDLFYGGPDRDGHGPEVDSRTVEESFRMAKAICATCPVIEACRLEVDRFEGDHTGYVWGVWAGETPQERVRRRSGRKASRPGWVWQARPPKHPREAVDRVDRAAWTQRLDAERFRSLGAR